MESVRSMRAVQRKPVPFIEDQDQNILACRSTYLHLKISSKISLAVINHPRIIMESLLSDHDAFLGKIAHLLQLEKKIQEVSLLATGKVTIEQTGCASWGNEDCDLFTVFIEIPSIKFVELGHRIDSLQKEILKKAQFLLRLIERESIEAVVISPDIPYDPKWREKITRAPASELAQDIETQRNLMVSVAAGGARIQLVNEEYKERGIRIQTGLMALRIKDPNPYKDLWEWYGKWRSGDLPTYQSRRQYLSDLFSRVIERLRTYSPSSATVVFPEPTGWAKIDSIIEEARRRLAEAKDEIGYQQLGLICRETLILLAQTVYDPTRHPIIDGVEVSPTDAKRMLEAYLQSELGGHSNEVARKHARASLEFANDLTHKRTATFKNAALCAEATSSVINIIAIVSGQRNP